MIDETMKTLTEELISRGTSYDIDFLKRVYADDLKFVRILPDNTVQILSKQDNIDFFQTLKDSGAAPQRRRSPEHSAHHTFCRF